jgi:hypothetical protein
MEYDGLSKDEQVRRVNLFRVWGSRLVEGLGLRACQG